jgi:hypothetical protein
MDGIHSNSELLKLVGKGGASQEDEPGAHPAFG